MFDIGYSELLLIGIVALLVIGPKDLPRVMRSVGQWVSKARGMARHFRSGVDAMIRESEIEDMNKQWAAHNASIMAAHPNDPDRREDDWATAAGFPDARPPASETPAAPAVAQIPAAEAPAPAAKPAPRRRKAPPKDVA